MLQSKVSGRVCCSCAACSRWHRCSLYLKRVAEPEWGVAAACAQPPSLTDKVKEVFGLSEAAINPESRNLGPNEVGKDAIDEITAYASKADKATPGARGGC